MRIETTAISGQLDARSHDEVVTNCDHLLNDEPRESPDLEALAEAADNRQPTTRREAAAVSTARTTRRQTRG